MSIKDYPIQIRIKGKKGRPTNWEIECSRIISKEMSKKEAKKEVIKELEDLFIFGTCIIKIP